MNTAKDIVAPRMQGLQKLEKTLKKLDLSWKVIETTARVVSPPESAGYISTLEHTRLAFSQLAAEMVEQIALTHLENCQHDLASRAQVAIDILVRNLFERTADVGFIATDGPLVSYLLAPEAAAQYALRERLGEYRAKYTVYDDILVLDTSAHVLLSLQQRPDQANAAPAWWSQVMQNNGYLEVYERSPLFNQMAPVLLYAHRILGPDGQPCGAVVLKFDLQSELASIFKALQHPNTVLLLRDAQGRVVASSNEAVFSARAALDVPPPDAPLGQTLRHQGRDYLYAHCPTRGYQGYQGPGWTAATLVELDQAFASLQEDSPRGGEDDDIALNHPQLQQIIARARAIEEDLNRVIWNGKLTESGALAGSALSPLFAEVGRTSKQTISVFDDAIAELKTLLLGGRHAELAAHAALAVDIMDRNLYERANDCRWWALSEELCQLLQTLQGGPNHAAEQQAGAILAHLNSLYTVYRRVALFDRQGRILAVSRDGQSLATDAQIPSALLQRTLSLQGHQAYAVSAMEPHALADGASTYLYCAPIRVGTEPALGGIALAFNCQDELRAMLGDSLPAGSETVGCFIDPQGRVLSSTSADLPVGAVAEFAAALQDSGEGRGALCHWNGRSYLVGVAPSPGYREFKISDGYRDDVRSVLLSAVDRNTVANTRITLPQHASAAGTTHYGVVQCGRLLFGLASGHVLEAVAANQMAAAPVHSEAVGLLPYHVNGRMAMLPVFDTCRLTAQAPITDLHNAVAIVVRRNDGPIALLVNRLIDVIASARLEPPPGGISPQAPWINGYIHDQQASTEPVFTIDPNGLQIAPAEQAA